MPRTLVSVREPTRFRLFGLEYKNKAEHFERRTSISAGLRLQLTGRMRSFELAVSLPGHFRTYARVRL